MKCSELFFTTNIILTSLRTWLQNDWPHKLYLPISQGNAPKWERDLNYIQAMDVDWGSNYLLVDVGTGGHDPQLLVGE